MGSIDFTLKIIEVLNESLVAILLFILFGEPAEKIYRAHKCKEVKLPFYVVICQAVPYNSNA